LLKQCSLSLALSSRQSELAHKRPATAQQTKAQRHHEERTEAKLDRLRRRKEKQRKKRERKAAREAEAQEVSGGVGESGEQ
jgi:hypothetical protein